MNSPTVAAVEAAFHQAESQWNACDWFTGFGPLKLQLRGLTSVQAARLTKATCGQESQQWLAAATWLGRVEQAAAAAKEAAFNACDAWANGDFSLAKLQIERACAIEAMWHQEFVWEPLRRAISESLELA